MKTAIAKAIGINPRGLFEKATKHRQNLNRLHDPSNSSDTEYKVGDEVITSHGPGILTEYTSKDEPLAVELTIQDDELEDEVAYEVEFDHAGKTKNGARLRKPQVSFANSNRTERKDKITRDIIILVRKYIKDNCAVSPLMRDKVRKRISRNKWITESALIIMSTLYDLYLKFKEENPDVEVKYSTFKALRPWNLRHMKRETCLCQSDENYDGHVRCFRNMKDGALKQVFAKVEKQVKALREGESPTQFQKDILRLKHLMSTEHKDELVRECLCEGSFD